MAQHDHTYAVIMAGGIGSRFWPMSRSGRPKQFLDILDRGRTLIQMTADRLEPMVPADRMYVVTNARHKADILEQLPGIPEDQVLCEPFMRNTAPCLAYAAQRIVRRDPGATMVVAPADHLIEDEAGFRDVLTVAVDQAAETNQLLTLGITPTRPDTGYGYIQYEELPGASDARLRQVRTFTEKPDRALAEQFLGRCEEDRVLSNLKRFWSRELAWAEYQLSAGNKRPEIYQQRKTARAKLKAL